MSDSSRIPPDDDLLLDFLSGSLSPLALWRLQRRLRHEPLLRDELRRLTTLVEQLQQATLAEPSADLEAQLARLVSSPKSSAPLERSVEKKRAPSSRWAYYRAPLIAVFSLSALIFLGESNKNGAKGTNLPDGGPKNVTDLLTWQWLVFLLPLLLAALLALASAFGLMGDSEVSTEADHDHDLDGDADHEPGDHDGASHESATVLHWLGVGQAPLSVLLICLMIYWAFFGSLGNLLWGTGPIGVSIGLALVGSLFATSGTARLVHRYLPTHQSFAVKRHELIGREGVAIYPITETSGTVRLHDKLGTLRQLDSRITTGAATIPPDTRVVVVDYDPEKQVFTVQRWDDLMTTKTETK